MRLTSAFVKLPRQFDAARLAAEAAALPRNAWLPHPGRIPGNDAVPLITPGGAITDAFAGAMAPTPHLHACPYMLEIMADLGGVWGRSRLMGLAPGADVPEHVDVGYYWRTHLRIHIPIVTTPAVEFTCDGETVHMAAGECWAFDSFRRHKVRNGGFDKRIHLVIDTVGGERFWDLLAAAQLPDRGATAFRAVAPGSVADRTVAFEQVNAPERMSPWEVRCHIDYLLGQTPAGPARDAAAAVLDRFANAWMAAWAGGGGNDAATYRPLLDRVRDDLRRVGADTLLLSNRVPLDRALGELIFQVALPAATSAPPPRLAAAG